MDALKGVAILLVVAGHSIESLPNFDANIFFRVIYAFHMPLFMFISGFVAALGTSVMGFKFLRKKFFLLAIPFVAWYWVSYFANGTYHTLAIRPYVKRLVLSPDWGLWFLWVLFLNFCLLALAVWLKKKIGWPAFLLVWGAMWLEPINYFGFSLVKWHFGFFLLGYLVNMHREKLQPWKKVAYAISAVGFPLLVAFWHRTTQPSFDAALQPWLNQHHLGIVNGAVTTAYAFAVPILGIGLVYWLVGLLAGGYIYSMLAWLGLFTMDIYVSHQYFVQFAFGSGEMRILSAIIVALAASLGLSFLVVRRSKVVSQLFLGHRKPGLGLHSVTDLVGRFKRAWRLATKAA